MDLLETLKARLRIEEDVREKVYIDSKGIPTIGVGRNLKDKGLRPDEIELLLSNDVADCLKECQSFPFWNNLLDEQRLVLLDMCFNLGFDGLSEFTHMLDALNKGDYKLAAQQMLQSRWATEVGKRATELAELMAQSR